MENAPKLEKKNETPFKGSLSDSNISEVHKGSRKLSELENSQNKIIRIESFEDLNSRYANKIAVIELVQTANRLYRELEEKYNILAPVNFLIGNNESGDKVVYSAVDKIEKANLNNTENLKEVSEQTEALYTSVAKYFFDKLKEGGFYLTDIKLQSICLW